MESEFLGLGEKPLPLQDCRTLRIYEESYIVRNGTLSSEQFMENGYI